MHFYIYIFIYVFIYLLMYFFFVLQNDGSLKLIYWESGGGGVGSGEEGAA